MLDEELEDAEFTFIINFCLWHRVWIHDGGENIFTDFNEEALEDFMSSEYEQDNYESK